ncbi:MAG TPA: hybrid sensor histidine kinase/response regulator [Bacteroidales bacterium]|nr:hybrid sensor histidine kinase/response regulator [Bacteroidales bacterium]
MLPEKPTVLIVDDQPINLRLAAEVLKNDYRILIADNGEKAIKATRERKPDLILLDIMMPETSGIQVAKILKEDNETKDIPIIFLTAKSQPEDTVEAFMAGGVDYLTKPFQKLELLQRIKTHIQLSYQKKELFQTGLELKQLNEEKNKLFSMVAHDLRNFVGGSHGLLKITLQKFDQMDRETLREYMEIVMENLEKTTLLMNELLAWSHKQSHALSFSPQHFLLKPEVLKNLDNYKTMAEGKNIRLIGEVPDDMKIFGDRLMISTILRNLIHNAIKYTDSGGTVTVTAYRENDRTYVAVIDTGVGIPEEYLHTIFDEKAESKPGTSGEKGTAVGLKVCKNYVEKHHGSIYVKNNAGGGARFEFYIPEQAN